MSGIGAGPLGQERQAIMNIYGLLFLRFLEVGLFSVGGGYAAIPFIQSRIVVQHAWLGLNEFTDLVTIAEMTPGPIAINAATFVGIRIAGLPGALVAVMGCILPSCLFVSLLFFVYCKYKEMPTLQSVLLSLRPVVVALIASAGLSILLFVVFWGQTISLSHVNWISLLLFILAFALLRKCKMNPILVMVLCGVLSLALGAAGIL